VYRREVYYDHIPRNDPTNTPEIKRRFCFPDFQPQKNFSVFEKETMRATHVIPAMILTIAL
jgi:hypothetical protein